jgi:NAD(P)-dependent dehydrogenase (short-subunit alcohol dehydrogenase family)
VSAFKDQLLAGKTAFIAGGTSGINLGIARRFAELGARVAVAGRNPEKAANAAALQDELGRSRFATVSSRADLSICSAA